MMKIIAHRRAVQVAAVSDCVSAPTSNTAGRKEKKVASARRRRFRIWDRPRAIASEHSVIL